MHFEQVRFLFWNVLVNICCIFTARIRRIGKVMFSQVSIHLHPGGVPQSQVLSQVLSRRYPSPSLGVPQSQSGRRYPSALVRTQKYPKLRQHLGTPPQPGQDWGTPLPHQDSRVSTCYTAGGMTLAVTQEDFLVSFNKTVIYILVANILQKKTNNVIP